jgi:methylmalonyl-CoA epimerase
MISKIDHIAIAVEDIEKAATFFTDALGLSVSGREDVPEQKTRVAFINIGQVRIELIQPMSSDSPVQKFLDKKGQGIHHLAVGTDDIETELEKLKDKGVRLIDNKPRKGAHDAKIAFLHPKSSQGVLLELCERSSQG